jgi:hypothetical protein
MGGPPANYSPKAHCFNVRLGNSVRALRLIGVHLIERVVLQSSCSCVMIARHVGVVNACAAHMHKFQLTFVWSAVVRKI